MAEEAAGGRGIGSRMGIGDGPAAVVEAVGVEGENGIRRGDRGEDRAGGLGMVCMRPLWGFGGGFLL